MRTSAFPRVTLGIATSSSWTRSGPPNSWMRTAFMVSSGRGENLLMPDVLRLTLLGIGAMRSPRYRPAGLLVEWRGRRVALDGGPGATPRGHLDAWLVTDERSELRSSLRVLAARKGFVCCAAGFAARGLRIAPLEVVHTSHPAFGYRIEAAGRCAGLAPEVLTFPQWGAGGGGVVGGARGWGRAGRFSRGG